MDRMIGISVGAGHCTCCGRPLNPARMTWLELNFQTGLYSAEPVPADQSQGTFEFGSACAKRVLKTQKAA